MAQDRGALSVTSDFGRCADLKHQLCRMLMLLSPAKDLDETPMPSVKGTTQPRFLDQSAMIMGKLRTMSPQRIARMMELSGELAELNHQRFQDWSPPFSVKNAKPALYMFNGEAYRGLDAATLTAAEVKHAQGHLRLLSGLYGSLRPLDLIQPYRLEMGCPIQVARGTKGLYAFWGDRLADSIVEDARTMGTDVVVNLASAEYFRAVERIRDRTRVVTPVFKERTPTGHKTVMVFAKRQRGRMTRWLLQHRALDPAVLREYDVDGYRFNAGLSEGDEWVFERPLPAKR